jgi:hypothetical protein
MRFASSTDLAIAVASKAGTLTLAERPSRFGDTYVAIADNFGIIEVQATMAEAQARVSNIAQRVA